MSSPSSSAERRAHGHGHRHDDDDDDDLPKLDIDAHCASLDACIRYLCDSIHPYKTLSRAAVTYTKRWVRAILQTVPWEELLGSSKNESESESLKVRVVVRRAVRRRRIRLDQQWR